MESKKQLIIAGAHRGGETIITLLKEKQDSFIFYGLKKLITTDPQPQRAMALAEKLRELPIKAESKQMQGIELLKEKDLKDCLLMDLTDDFQANLNHLEFSIPQVHQIILFPEGDESLPLGLVFSVSEGDSREKEKIKRLLNILSPLMPRTSSSEPFQDAIN